MAENIYSTPAWNPLHVRDNFLFVRGNVKGFNTQGSEKGVNEIVAGNSNPGSYPDTPAVIAIAHGFGAASQPGNIRSIDVEHLFNFAGSTSIISATSIAGVRGCISIAAPTTFASGYLYGISGKIVVQGTLSTANFVAGVQAQLDLSAAVGLSSVNLSAIWADMGATISAAVISSGQAGLSIVKLTNTAPGSMINAVFHVEALATYLFDVSNTSYSPFITTTAPGTAYGRIAINTSAGVKYIGVYNA